jgi:Lrp/AsnC family transcriptional regulator for asnA, asnC and gidA
VHHEVRGLKIKTADATDRAIISYLQYDGRMAYTEIAQELSISEGAVRSRVKRLLDSKMLQIVGIADPRYVRLEAPAMIGLVVKAGEIDNVANKIGNFPEVSYLFMTSGTYNLFVSIYCRDNAHLVDFLENQLGKIDQIESSETFMILKMHKMSYRWGDDLPPSGEKPVDLDWDSLEEPDN